MVAMTFARELLVAAAFLNTMTVPHLSDFDRALNAIALVIVIYSITSEFKSWLKARHKEA